jgi:acetyl-CoA carboxylase carboxyl transferase subunit alpha
MFTIKTPIICIIIGEGGSGGALALAIGDKVMMLEHSVYSVISPEGCAAILWKNNNNSVGPIEYAKASEALKLTSRDLQDFGVIDEIIPEPLGGAHRDREEAAKSIGNVLKHHIEELSKKPVDSLIDERYNKFRLIGKLTSDAQK